MRSFESNLMRVAEKVREPEDLCELLGMKTINDLKNMLSNGKYPIRVVIIAMIISDRSAEQLARYITTLREFRGEGPAAIPIATSKPPKKPI